MVATKYSRQRLSGLNRGNEPREWFYDRRAALHPRVFSTFPTCVIVTIRNTYVNERRRAKTPRPSCGFSLQGANQRHLGLLTLDILGDDVMSRGLLAPVPNSDGRAPHDLPRVTLRVELAEKPLACRPQDLPINARKTLLVFRRELNAIVASGGASVL